ncbi:MAG: AI-2E family transporter [Gemmataceae bacterium]
MADSADPTKSLQRTFYFMASLILVFGLLYWAQHVLIPLALAILFTFILSPAVAILQRKGLGRVPSAIIVMLAALLLVIGTMWIVLRQMDSLAKELSEEGFRQRLNDRIGRLLSASSDGFLHNFQDVANQVTAIVQQKTRGAANTGANGDQPIQTVRVEQSPFSEILSAAGPAAEFLGTAALIVVLVAFMLVKREDLRNRLVRLFGHGRLIVTTRAFNEAGDRISRYLVMQVLINALFGVVIMVGLALLGIRYAPLWGFVCGLLRFIPYLGTWVGAGLLELFCVATTDGWRDPLLAFALFLVLEIVVANVVEPLLFGHSTGVSPFALLVAAAFWLFMWGPVGLILSTPLTVCLVVLGKYVPQLEFFDVALSDEPVLDPEVSYYQRLLAHDQDEAIELVEQHIEEKPLETVYEEVLLPAIVLARRDEERGDLSEHDAKYVFESTRDTLRNIVAPVVATEQGEEGKKPPSKECVTILGCPATDEADELALEMFQSFLFRNGCQFEMLSSHTLTSEIPAKIEEFRPALVIISAIPPGALAHARYLCKRLRSRFPDLKMLVGRWGAKGDSGRIQDRLSSAGADYVGFTFEESRSQIVPLIQVAASPDAEPAGKKPEPALSH